MKHFRFPALAGLFLVLLPVLALASGCAAKKELPRAPIAAAQGSSPERHGAAPAPGAGTASEFSAPGTADAPAGQTSAPQERPEEQPREQQVEQQGAQKARTLTGESPARRMLEKAGRNPDAEQPEAGFSLAVPDKVGDGEAFFVAFGANDAQKLTVVWREKKRTLTEKNPVTGRFEMLLPVPLDEKAKSLPLSLAVTWADGRTETLAADLPVARRKYPVQKLTVAPKYVRHPPEMDEKVKRDRAEFNAAVSKFTPVRYWSLPFLRPVPGEVTSLYGNRRVFNNKPSNPHKGVDFDAKAGDPILAVEEGVVVLTSDHYYSGNITIIDHGLGVMSVYLHQSAFNVGVGQHVRRGDVIGFIGSTGRSTGPHLHLSLLVQGVSVNAAPCLDM